MDIDKINNLPLNKALKQLNNPFVSMLFELICSTQLKIDKDAKFPTIQQIMEAIKEDKDSKDIMNNLINELKEIEYTEDKVELDYGLQELVEAYKEQTQKDLEED